MSTSQPSGLRPALRTEIDDAARRIAFSSGLGGITLRRLASTVGVDPGLIAQHEPSMGALVARIFQDLAADERAQTELDLASQPTPLDALRVLVHSLLEASHDDYNSVWADAWSIGRRSTPLARAARDSMSAWNAVVHDLVARGIAAGQFAETEPDLVAMQFFALIDSTTAYSLVGYRTADERARLVRRTLEISLGLPEATL
jgi:AcrR family transcriptional regulator